MPLWLNVLIDPHSRNDDRRRREFILNILLVSSTTIVLVAFAFLAIESIRLGPQFTGQSPLPVLVLAGVFAGLWTASRKGFFVAAAYILVGIFLLLSYFMLFSFSIMLPQGLLLLSFVLVMSSILLGTKAASVLVFFSSIILIVLGALQHDGKIMFDNAWMKSPGGVPDAIGFSLTLSIITTVSWLSNREIERFNLTLQDQVRKATNRLLNANKKLKGLDKTKDEFLSMASHQLGTPLTAITGYLSMALDDDKANMTPAQKQYVQYALEASERMGALTSDLLNVSRLNAGRFVVRPEPVDLNAMARQEVDQLRATAERKGLKLIFRPAPKLPPIMADASKTRQVIMNFIDNAIYYTETGSVTVTVEQHHNAVAYTVKDTGIGVPPGAKAKLFSKFFRADNAKATRPDGTGLGLYLAKRVIQDQGGSIIFESEVGKGSTFGFLLPMKVPPATLPAPAPTP